MTSYWGTMHKANRNKVAIINVINYICTSAIYLSRLCIDSISLNNTQKGHYYCYEWEGPAISWLNITTWQILKY